MLRGKNRASSEAPGADRLVTDLRGLIGGPLGRVGLAELTERF